jgi:uncharacterized protein
MTDAEYKTTVERLRKTVKERLERSPGCHDFEHVARVARNALELAALEKDGDVRVIETAALTHDIARPEEMESGGKICHAQKGSEIVAGILKEAGFTDTGFMEKVRLCVLRHRFRGKNKPVTIEEKIVYDADKLDSAGAVGIGRAFHFAGRIGAGLHNTEAEALASPAYGRGDTAYREYLVKLSKIPERVMTASGKKLALERAEFMKTFFDRLNREVYGGAQAG